METLLSIQDKVFYVNYKGAIRQAKFDSAVCWPNRICGGKASITLKWKVAGIGEPKTYCDIRYKVYYSIEDAEDEKNNVQIEELGWQTVNKYSDNFYVSESGYPMAYMWDGAKPFVKDLIYSLEKARSEFNGKAFVLVSDPPKSLNGVKLRRTLEELGAFYKTAEECKAHYRPKVVTF